MNKKPEKLLTELVRENWAYHRAKGYNDACEEWENFLPNKKELEDTINRMLEHYTKHFHLQKRAITNLASIITKRIGKNE